MMPSFASKNAPGMEFPDRDSCVITDDEKVFWHVFRRQDSATTEISLNMRKNVVT